MPTEQDPDLLYGVRQIAGHLGLSERQARNLVDRGALPSFTLPGGAIRCARRSTLTAWLGEQERAGRPGAAP